jgi:hypothetical protein
MVEGFALLPVGQWFRYVVGLMEVVGGVAVLVPAFSGLGALLLLVVDVGAFFAQILFLHEDWIHTIVIGAILAALVYLQLSICSGTRSAHGWDCEASERPRPARLERALTRSLGPSSIPSFGDSVMLGTAWIGFVEPTRGDALSASTPSRSAAWKRTMPKPPRPAICLLRQPAP